MTNAPVTNNKASYVMDLTKKVNTVRKGSGTDSFSQVMDRTVKDGVQENASEPRDDNAVHAAARADNSGRKVLKEQKNAEIPQDDAAADENAQAAVEEAAQKLVETIADQLGISVEEVRNALENLGLTPTDLMGRDNLADLLMELSPDGDMLSLLTDENMYGAFAKLTRAAETAVQELKEALNLTDEEFGALLEESRKASGVESSVQGNVEGTDLELQPGPVKQPEGEAVQTSMKAETLTEKAMTQAKGETAEKAIPIEVENKPAQKDEVPQVKTEVQGTAADSGSEKNWKDLNGQDSSGDKDAKEDGSAGRQAEQPLFQTVAGRFNQVQETPQETQVLKQTADTESIMRQIMDYMKVQVKADMTQMEIQLHPSSLGNINVQIASREGVITAQFTTQNEGVKAALEAQIVQLKENLNEQGLKVEAVEVTVASHEFERQMDGRQKDGGETQEARKKGTRRISLDGMDGFEDAQLEDEDKLTADMMVRNGNTVDYMA